MPNYITKKQAEHIFYNTILNKDIVHIIADYVIPITFNDIKIYIMEEIESIISKNTNNRECINKLDCILNEWKHDKMSIDIECSILLTLSSKNQTNIKLLLYLCNKFNDNIITLKKEHPQLIIINPIFNLIFKYDLCKLNYST